MIIGTAAGVANLQIFENAKNIPISQILFPIMVTIFVICAVSSKTCRKYLFIRPFSSSLSKALDQTFDAFFGRNINKNFAEAVINGVFALIYAVIITSIAPLIYPIKPSSSDFYNSFLASLLEDAVFFVCIGIVAVVAAQRDPSSDDFQDRISSLFNSTAAKQSEDARVFLADQIRSKSYFSPQCTTEIEFREYNPKLCAVRTVVRMHRTLENMLADQIIEDREFDVSLDVDEVGPAGTIRGEIESLYVETGAGDPRYLIGDRIPATENIEERVQISIPRNGRIVVHYNYWVWFKKGAQFIWENRQFTENYRFVLRNLTEHRLEFSETEDTARAQLILTAGEEKPYPQAKFETRRFVVCRLDDVTPV